MQKSNILQLNLSKSSNLFIPVSSPLGNPQTHTNVNAGKRQSLRTTFRTGESALRKRWINITTTLFLALIPACGGGGSSLPPASPVINSFATTNSLITEGTSTDLIAVFSNGVGSIDQGVGNVTSGIPVHIDPLKSNTTFTLTVKGSGGSASAALSINVVSAPSAAIFVQDEVPSNAGGLQASAPAQTGMTYKWTMEDLTASGSITQGSTSDVVVFGTGPSAGTCRLTLAVQNLAGTVASSSRTIRVVKSQFLKDAKTLAPRAYHTSTRLCDGRILVTGGDSEEGVLASAEMYDPATGIWASVGSMSTKRYQHTATLLADGRVLVAGGCNYEGTRNAKPSILSSAELFDPATRTWSPAANTAFPRVGHSATLLLDGRVLVAGWGQNAEIYDPFMNAWTDAGGTSLRNECLLNHAATLLPGGKVLITGGSPLWTQISQSAQEGKDLETMIGDAGYDTSSVEVYDPSTNSWSSAHSMALARREHTATLLSNGKVLVTGGEHYTTVDRSLSDAELYDPSSDTWTSAGTMNAARANHTASILPNGKVLVTGGRADHDRLGFHLCSTELYDPALNTWSLAGNLATSRCFHTATFLQNGKLLVVGGYSNQFISSPEIYDVSSAAWTPVCGQDPRHRHIAILLQGGDILVAGGNDGSLVMDSARLFSPSTGSWTQTESMRIARDKPTATLLPSGQVLLAGGGGANDSQVSAQTSRRLPCGDARLGAVVTVEDSLETAEMYDPARRTWQDASRMACPRQQHTATLLLDGKVLVAGGLCVRSSTTQTHASSEWFDPAKHAWSPVGNMTQARSGHTATLLQNGKVLVAGGMQSMEAGVNPLASTELFDPASCAWTLVAAMTTPRYFHTAIRLSTGKILVVGGQSAPILGSTLLASAEVFDPASNTWTSAGQMFQARTNHTATLLDDGRVLIAGGFNNGLRLNAEIYDPATNTWVQAAMAYPRWDHTATLLPDSRVAIIGGQPGYNLEFWVP